MKFNCAYGSILDIDDPRIVENPKNPNQHSLDQIERLSKIIDYQGQRSPIVISNRSGFITKGHGRLASIKKLGWSKIAVDFQDYENEAQEYSDIVSDNAIAEWSTLDKELIISEIETLEMPDLEFLGFENLAIPEICKEELDYSDKNQEIDTENFGNDLEHTCPKCGFEFNE